MSTSGDFWSTRRAVSIRARCVFFASSEKLFQVIHEARKSLYSLENCFQNHFRQTGSAFIDLDLARVMAFSGSRTTGPSAGGGEVSLEVAEDSRLGRPEEVSSLLPGSAQVCHECRDSLRFEVDLHEYPVSPCPSSRHVHDMKRHFIYCHYRWHDENEQYIHVLVWLCCSICMRAFDSVPSD